MLKKKPVLYWRYLDLTVESPTVLGELFVREPPSRESLSFDGLLGGWTLLQHVESGQGGPSRGNEGSGVCGRRGVLAGVCPAPSPSGRVSARAVN